MATRTAARRVAHYQRLLGEAVTFRGRINAVADWARAAAGDLPAHRRADGLERFRRLVDDLEQMGADDDSE